MREGEDTVGLRGLEVVGEGVERGGIAGCVRSWDMQVVDAVGGEVEVGGDVGSCGEHDEGGLLAGFDGHFCGEVRGRERGEDGGARTVEVATRKIMG